MNSRPMIHGHRLNHPAAAHNKSWKKAVHMGKARQSQKCISTKHTNATAGIGSSIAEDCLPDGVGGSRADNSPEMIQTTLAMTGDETDVLSIFHGRCQDGQHFREVCGVVLAVGIQCRNHFAGGFHYARYHGIALPTGALVPYDNQFRTLFSDLLQDLLGVVRTSVVDDNNFETGLGTQGRTDFCNQSRQVFCLILRRQHHTKSHRAITFSGILPRCLFFRTTFTAVTTVRLGYGGII